MSPSQAEAYGLALNKACGNIKPHAVLKNLILSSVSVPCNTDWMDALSKIKYANVLAACFSLSYNSLSAFLYMVLQLCIIVLTTISNITVCML